MSAHFLGQQEGERLLWTIRAHYLGMLPRLFMASLPFGIGLAMAFVIPALGIAASVSGCLITFTIAAHAIAQRNLSVTFITDRRIVARRWLFPGITRERALFYSEVMKVRGVSYLGGLLDLLKIGRVEILPRFGDEQHNIAVPFVFYFKDVVAYLDKLIYLENHNREELKTVRPFIAAPRGARGF